MNVLLCGQEIVTICLCHFNRIPERDGQRDKQNSYINIACQHCDKKLNTSASARHIPITHHSGGGELKLCATASSRFSTATSAHCYLLTGDDQAEFAACQRPHTIKHILIECEIFCCTLNEGSVQKCVCAQGRRFY